MKRIELILIIIALISTTLTNLLLKLQDTQRSMGTKYIHPFLQCFCMFLGEHICLYWYGLQTKTKTKKQISSPVLFCLPAIIDLIASCFFTFGLIFCAISVAQIIYSFQIVITAILSKLILKKKSVAQQITGIVFVFAGVAITGFASLTEKEVYVQTYETNSTGIILVIIANILWPIQFVIEERLFRSYNYNALEAIGYEGLAGTTIFLLLIPFMYNIKCAPFYLDQQKKEVLCALGRLEDGIFAIEQMINNYWLIVSTVVYILMTSLVNFSMIAIIKHGSAMSSVTVSCIRMVILWVISLWAGWEEFLMIELVGFLFVMLGSMLFHNVIKVPGFQQEIDDEVEKNIHNS